MGDVGRHARAPVYGRCSQCGRAHPPISLLPPPCVANSLLMMGPRRALASAKSLECCERHSGGGRGWRGSVRAPRSAREDHGSLPSPLPRCFSRLRLSLSYRACCACTSSVEPGRGTCGEVAARRAPLRAESEVAACRDSSPCGGACAGQPGGGFPSSSSFGPRQLASCLRDSLS